MPHRIHPERHDYQALFELYPGVEFWRSEARGRDDPYLFLFHQVMTLLARESAFNRTLPAPFRETATRYAAGEPDVVRHFQGADNRVFLLSDLQDWLRLKG